MPNERKDKNMPYIYDRADHPIRFKAHFLVNYSVGIAYGLPSDLLCVWHIVFLRDFAKLRPSNNTFVLILHQKQFQLQ